MKLAARINDRSNGGNVTKDVVDPVPYVENRPATLSWLNRQI